MALTKPAGTWTYDDLLSLPDDGRRYEIIEGGLYEMPAPSWEHQLLIANLLLLLGPVVRSLGGKIVPAPLDVFFSGADPVEPDLVAILPGSRATGRGRGVEGPPDLVVEVLSPSNRAHDLLTKRALYARGGVREYWIVDPVNQTVDVLSLHVDAFHRMQLASREALVHSPVLGAEFPVSGIFVGIGDDEA
jgi:Uma2 family endonuclease